VPTPNLIHPINCTLERIDKAATIYDEDAREPVQRASRFDAIQISAQPHWFSERELQTLAQGPNDSSRGYLLFRYVDLLSAGIMVQINDRVTMQGHLPTEVYITRTQPMGHYPDQNGASLLKAWFTDRNPAKTR
jgi:hypothetical protein